MKLIDRTFQKGDINQLRKDVSVTISNAGRFTIPKHHEFKKRKNEDDNYQPIKQDKDKLKDLVKQIFNEEEEESKDEVEAQLEQEMKQVEQDFQKK